jgi:hypothetical protein
MLHKRSLPARSNPLLAPDRTPSSKSGLRQAYSTTVLIVARSYRAHRPSSPWPDKPVHEAWPCSRVKRGQAAQFGDVRLCSPESAASEGPFRVRCIPGFANSRIILFDGTTPLQRRLAYFCHRLLTLTIETEQRWLCQRHWDV